MSQHYLMANYGPRPITFVRGQGSFLFDDEGRDYVDFLCGIAVTSLGHANPAVTAAIAEQAATLNHVSNLFGNELADSVAGTINDLINRGPLHADGQVFFSNSGTEANEAAFKLARRFHDGARPKVVSTWNSFHGRTMASLAATGQPAKHVGFAPLPEGFSHVDFGDLSVMEEALRDPQVGAVLVEPIQGEGGIVVPSSDYLAGLRDLCDAAGALLIADEVQTGFGRTGDWFGSHHDGVLPDIITMAKSLGNGMPIGACWARLDVASAFVPGDHGSTFGGQPLALAAAKATLAEMERIDAPSAARHAGEHLRSRLVGAPGVRAVRGRGLLLGAELDLPAGAVAAAGLVTGVVLNAVRPDVLRLAPPINISRDDLDLGIDRLIAALTSAKENHQ